MFWGLGGSRWSGASQSWHPTIKNRAIDDKRSFHLVVRLAFTQRWLATPLLYARMRLSAQDIEDLDGHPNRFKKKPYFQLLHG
eukprot:718315-Amphidinium_carterae.1